MLVRSTSVIIIVCLTFLSYNVMACGPFDLEVKIMKADATLKSMGSRGGKSIGGPQKLGFAQDVISDAKTVHSDAGFIHIPGFQGDSRGLRWKLNLFPEKSSTMPDTRLSSENTMLEFAGYFRDFLKIKDLNTDGFLTKKVMKNFDQIAVGDLVKYPGGEEPSRVRNAVNKTFGNPEGVLNLMERKNRNAGVNGLVYFSRPSFMSSETVRGKYGDGALLACMAVAYGRDIYTNNDISDSVKPQLYKIPMQAIRSSIIDRMAAEALERKQKGQNVEEHSISLSSGNVYCKLEKNEEYMLKPIWPANGARPKCFIMPKVKQPAAVVRRGPATSRDQRFVQVGDELFTVKCRYYDRSGGYNSWRNWIDVADWSASSATSEAGFIEALLWDPQLSKTELGNNFLYNRDKLARPQNDEASKKFVMGAAKQCDDVMTRGKANKPEMIVIRPKPPIQPDFNDPAVIKPEVDSDTHGLGEIVPQ